jgi:hypothetical protein
MTLRSGVVDIDVRQRHCGNDIDVESKYRRRRSENVDESTTGSIDTDKLNGVTDL